jgi:hypothetical protein
MAANSKSLGGVESYEIDGVQYAVVGEPKWRVATLTRETAVSMTGVDGFNEKPIQGYIAAKLRCFVDTSVASFQGMRSVTVRMKMRSGKQVAGAGMWSTEAQEVDVTESVFDVRFEGNVQEF